jgi:uncharacterized protein YodC (DUF2158 family)
MKPGDLVRLKSGGPVMTIRWVAEGDAYCEWFDGAKITGHRFALAALVADAE